MKPIKRALISVSDKSGLIPFARALAKQKVEILSTGGTLKALKGAGIPARAVSEVTEFSEILGGRVKTLHPRIHGGILYRRGQKSHEREIRQHRIPSIDLVVVNLYPFESVVGAALGGRPNSKQGAHRGVPLHTAVENIDIGGPAMLRAAAKNFESVTVVMDPNDYPLILEEMKKNRGGISTQTRIGLAQKVFERTSAYDRKISDYLSPRLNPSSGLLAGQNPPLPARVDLAYEKTQDLRYGENPHQRGALYRRSEKFQFDFKMLHGKELSFNNLLDFEATVELLREFDSVAACVVKHTNPCGVAEGKNLAEALQKAIEGDPLSSFGGIVGLNRPCDLKAAQKLYEMLHFLEVVVAPRFEPAALRFLKTRKNVRLIEAGSRDEFGPWDLRVSPLGLLLQDRDPPIRLYERALKKKIHCVTALKVSPKEIDELIFAWKCVKRVRSNAIVITKNRQAVGIGAGQMSRVDSVEIACRKAGFRAEGAFLASDAFFPMPDSIELAGRAGIRAIIQPGGSIRDGDVIQACNHVGLAMVFTGERHFRH